MQSDPTTEVLVSIVAGKVQLTVDGVPTATIQVHNGDSVRWSPKDSAASLVLVFPVADKPVEKPVYLGNPGVPITIVLEGIVNKHYRYSVVVLKDVPYIKAKPGELSLSDGDYPPKFTVDVVAEDPVVIIR